MGHIYVKYDPVIYLEPALAGAFNLPAPPLGHPKAADGNRTCSLGQATWKKNQKC